MRLLLVFVCSAFLFSCVPARKFQELQATNGQLRSENQQMQSSLEEANGSIKDLKIELERLRKSQAELQADTLRQGTVLRRLQTRYDKINSLNDELLEKYALLQKGNQVEQQKLLSELEKTKTELQEREDVLNTLEKELQEKKASLDEINRKLVQREQRVNELESLLAEKDRAFNDLTNKLVAALTDYSEKGLKVEQRDGKIYVSVEAKLLFPSGSTSIDKEGKKALVDLARVLESQKDIEILVEGHTDSDKITSKTIPTNNWELSVLRATSVVEILTENSKLNPAQLIAAGRSQFHPIDAEDKAKNRRIEIILTPNLDRVFEIINNKGAAKQTTP